MHGLEHGVGVFNILMRELLGSLLDLVSQLLSAQFGGLLILFPEMGEVRLLCSALYYAPTHHHQYNISHYKSDRDIQSQVLRQGQVRRLVGRRNRSAFRGQLNPRPYEQSKPIA